MRSPVNTRWEGQRKLVIGIDIGATQSAVSYAYLYPTGEQFVKRITRWPGQEAQKNDTKIPSIVWYDSNQKAQSFGAEAAHSDMEDKAESSGWQLAQYFKLHLNPQTMRVGHKDEPTPLPDGVTIEQVYADFMGYLFQHTETYFMESEIGGATLWMELKDSIDFVIAHPNGWGLNEQALLKRAAIAAGLVDSAAKAEQHIQFVSEAEASAHFVLFDADFHSRFEVGVEFLVCDAGGSTVDTTLYAVEATEPELRLTEKKASACIQAGGIYVNKEAKEHFAAEFGKTKKAAPERAELVKKVMANFEEDLKRTFKNLTDDKGVQIGGAKFKLVPLKVNKGRLALTGKQTASFFDPYVNMIIESIRKQIEGHRPKYLLIVGGFGESPYLRSKIQVDLKKDGVEVVLAEDSTVKAVSDGAVIWYLKHTVIARATRFAFGTDGMKPVVLGFADRPLLTEPDGVFVDGVWREVVPAGFVMKEDEVRKMEFRLMFDSPMSLGDFGCKLYSHDNNDVAASEWLLNPDGSVCDGFRLVCTISADLSGLEPALKARTAPAAASQGVWELAFQVVIKFGTTSLKAALVWEEDGLQREGPASLITPELA